MKLLVQNLPNDITVRELTIIFSRFSAFVGVQMLKKMDNRGHRRALIGFSSTLCAIESKMLLDGYLIDSDDPSTAMLIREIPSNNDRNSLVTV